MVKWPNVPHCYGWLGLDARGHWRMRDERAQALQLSGDKVTQAALLGFINRNYLVDALGRWYFQNGPQRVYVNLESTPFIVRSDPKEGYLLHTGAVVETLRRAWMTGAGGLVLDCDGKIAALDDRDLAQVMQDLLLDGAAVSDEALMDWLDGGAGELRLQASANTVLVERLGDADLAQHFGFVREPLAPTM